MKITKLEELRDVIELLSNGKAYYEQSIIEGSISIRYNAEKNCMEEHCYQGNPYSGNDYNRVTVFTAEQLFEQYKDHPDMWENFGVYK